MAISKVRKIWSQGRKVRQSQGLTGVLKRGFLLLISPVYKRDLVYLYEKPVMTDYAPPDMDPRDLHFFVVPSNAEADALEARGFAFRNVPTDWNSDRKTYTRWLSYGAIAFCTFVGQEFGAINWVIPGREVQKKITWPLQVDYDGRKVFPRGAWVNPKYRSRGLIRYTVQQRDYYLASRGIVALQTMVHTLNEAGFGLVGALGSRLYGRGYMTRILWWKIWKETRDN